MEGKRGVSSDPSLVGRARPVESVRLGIVGTGFGRYGLLPAFRRDPRCTVVAIASQSSERAAAYARDLSIPASFAGWQDLLADADVDAIAVAAPPAVQPDIVEGALNKGLAVFAEKPFAPNRERAAVLAALAERTGLPNMIDFLFPELETWRRAKAALDGQAIGEVRHFAVDWRMESYDNRKRLTGWKSDAGQGGGVLQHFACHTLYYLEWLFGPIAQLSAALGSARDLARDGDTLATLSLRFASGVTGAVYCCSAATLRTIHSVEVFGAEGLLRLANDTPDPVAGFQLALATRADPTLRLLAAEPAAKGQEDSRVAPVARMARRFIDWCVGGAASAPSFRDAERNQELIAAVQRAAREGRVVDVAPSPPAR